MLSGRFPMNSIPHPPFLHDERHDLLDDDRNLYCQGEPERLERHMRVNREEAAENRERIVEAAARLFREHGLDGAISFRRSITSDNLAIRMNSPLSVVTISRSGYLVRNMQLRI